MTPDRVYAQYRNKPKARAWYNITSTVAQEILDAAEKVGNTYDIQTQIGEQLNILGRIVVVNRSVIANVPLEVVEFDDTTKEFGDESAQFSETSIDEDRDLSDDYFRILIIAKAWVNNSDATITENIKALQLILTQTQDVRVIDREDMSYDIEIYGIITDVERWLLGNRLENLVPRPGGVELRGVIETLDYTQFGDDTKEFGDESAEFVGYLGD